MDTYDKAEAAMAMVYTYANGRQPYTTYYWYETSADIEGHWTDTHYSHLLGKQ
jgi:hypothetical protein